MVHLIVKRMIKQGMLYSVATLQLTSHYHGMSSGSLVRPDQARRRAVCKAGPNSKPEASNQQLTPLQVNTSGGQTKKVKHYGFKMCSTELIVDFYPFHTLTPANIWLMSSLP